MAVFSEKEIAYLGSQRLGRLATVGRDGAPHTVPVGYRYNPALDTIEIGGHALGRTRKFHDVQRDSRVSFVVDDLETMIRDTIDKLAPQEREVQDKAGRWHSLRVRPYKTVDSRLGGAVVAVVDVDAAKRLAIEAGQYSGANARTVRP